MSEQKPISELPNEFCMELDGSLDPIEFCRVLRSADSQIFSGYKGYEGLFDERIAQNCSQVVGECSSLLRKRLHGNSNVSIVMTGCGTSGRIAFLTSRRFNMILSAADVGPSFGYLISGGDSALLLSDELPEDDPVQGASDLDEHFEKHGKDGLYFIGITCGLSAPYVAGQIEHILSSKNDKKSACVLGFNPIQLSRDKPIEKFEDHRTFRDVLTNLQNTVNYDTNSHAIINPVVGPEPVAGSSRMKGGSATAILLDCLCLKSLCSAKVFNDDHALMKSIGSKSMHALFEMYQTAHNRTYSSLLSGSNCTHLRSTMSAASNSLLNGGRLFFIGSGSAGCVGFIDASEMPDTYGSPFDQIRGFVEGGWENTDVGIGNSEGDMSAHSHLHRLSLQQFNEDFSQNLAENDTVIYLSTTPLVCMSNEMRCALSKLTKPKLVMVNCTDSGLYSSNMDYVTEGSSIDDLSELIQKCTAVIAVDLAGVFPYAKIQNEKEFKVLASCDGIFAYSLKIVTNAISTYAQAAGRGALFKGLMVSTGPANDKIYQRCVNLIAETVMKGKGNLNENAKVDTFQRAEKVLIRAIYRTDDVKHLLHLPRSSHIKKSILPEDQRDKAQVVLPLALLLGTGKFTIQTAEAALRKEPRVSQLLKQLDGAKDKSTSQGYIVGVDLGGTNVRAAAINTQGGLESEVQRKKISDRSFDSVAQLIVDCVSAVIAKLGPQTCEGVSIAQPGCVSHAEDGQMISNLASFMDAWGSKQFPLAKVVREKLQYPLHVHICDDAKATLAAEVNIRKRKGASLRSVCMIAIGTGVGTSICNIGNSGTNTYIDGERGLVEGGHMIVNVTATGGDLRVCACGQSGCLESYCSGPAICAAANSAEGRIVYDNCESVFEALRLNSASAVSAVDDAARFLAVGIVNMVRAYDPSVVVLGGGDGGLAETLLPLVLEHYKSLSWTIYDDLNGDKIQLRTCVESGVIGAALLYFEERGE